MLPTYNLAPPDMVNNNKLLDQLRSKLVLNICTLFSDRKFYSFRTCNLNFTMKELILFVFALNRLQNY